MTISILQLNINADNYWDNLVMFLTSNDFDIIQLQEVTGKGTTAGNLNSKIDCFAELKKIIDTKYFGEMAIAQRYASSPSSYMANATFYKKDYKLIEKNVLPLFIQNVPFPADSESYENVGRNLLHLKLQIGDKSVSFLNTHLAWAKTTIEQPHQTQQGKILFGYLQKIPHPFILTGDFNIDQKQPLIQKINSLARNLTTENNVVNTLNERTHRARILFPPGAAVDYIYVTEDLKVKNFEVLKDKDLSDHLGLTAEIEI